ncbi:MAG: hypothetical protein OHK0046_32590 [Anaerolineae bacterium]
MRLRFVYIIMSALLLAACGGGGNDENAPAQSTPVSQNPTATVEILVDEEGREFALPPADEGDSFEDQVGNILEAQNAQVPVLPTQTPASEGALPVPLPGTLVASETQEVEPIPDFTSITFNQVDGETGTTFGFQIFGDGRVVLPDGRSTVVSAETIAQLNQTIRDLNFFGLQGTYLGPPAEARKYRYQITVESGSIARTINAQDGFIPVELRQFLAAVRAIGESAQTA